MIILTLLASYWRWVLIGALAAVLWFQQSRIDGYRVQLAEKESAVQREKLARESAAQEHEVKLSAAERTHAIEQQTNLENFNEKITLAKGAAAAAERKRDIAVADAGRLRNELRAATSTGAHTPTDADTDTCRTSKLRLAELGLLAGEAAELLAEGEGLVDSAGQLLQDRELRLDWAASQMKIDRRAVDSISQN